MIKLSRHDMEILKRLKENARIKVSQIGEEIGTSTSTVTERLRRMEQNGVILGYTAIIDQKAVGNDVTALMEISLEHPKYYDAFTEMVEKTDCIVSCYYISGNFDFMLKILAPSEQLEEIHRTIKSFPGVSGTRTNVVLKALKNGYSHLPPQE
ncbi:MAG: Lrp/AsnC family transcriptional regulator [Clostridia bacterium]|nr:Lrp/AsnC family transcriptional regulator [Clostridia bacterium]